MSPTARRGADGFPMRSAEGYVRPQERSLADKLTLAAAIAGLVRFAGDADARGGTWAKLFAQEPAVMMAALLATRAEERRARFAELIETDARGAAAELVGLRAAGRGLARAGVDRGPRRLRGAAPRDRQPRPGERTGADAGARRRRGPGRRRGGGAAHRGRRRRRRRDRARARGAAGARRCARAAHQRRRRAAAGGRAALRGAAGLGRDRPGARADPGRAAAPRRRRGADQPLPRPPRRLVLHRRPRAGAAAGGRRERAAALHPRTGGGADRGGRRPGRPALAGRRRRSTTGWSRGCGWRRSGSPMPARSASTATR